MTDRMRGIAYVWCRACKKAYRPGKWTWSVWQCSICTKNGITPEAYR